MRTLPLLLATLIALPACVDDSEIVTDEAESPDGDDGKADTATQLTVRAGETSLWVDKAVLRDTRDGADGLVLRGRTSRNLTDGFGFVFDDPYGAFAIRTPRTFEVRWTTSELASLLVGVDQFIRLGFVHSNDRPDSLTARAVARLKMTAFTGTGSYLFTDVVPVVSGGRTMFRVSGSATSNILEVVAEVGPDRIEDVEITDPRHFQIDLSVDRTIAMAGGTAELAVSVRTSSGTRIKRGKLVATVKKLGLTTGDAYEVWPRGECEDEVRTCLGTHPSDTCGEALEVLACGGASAGVPATGDDGDRMLLAAEPAFATLTTDAPTLIGAGRASALLAGARRVAEENVIALFGTVYPSTTERDAALAAAIDAAIVDAYAFPLTHVPALTPLANNPVRSREVAADALLAFLATQDLVHTEYGRSYVELVRLYRAEHLTSIGEFRNSAIPEDIAGWPPYLFVGRWMGSYTEISVTQATGVATNVHFEID